MLTRSETIDLLNRAVQERGADWIYPKDALHGQCLYYVPRPDDMYDETVGFTDLNPGDPACIVGLVFSYIGVDYDEIDSLMCNTTDVFNTHCDVSQSRSEALFDHGSLELLATVQKAQDEGVPWGVAVREAIAYVNYANPWAIQ